MVNTAFTITELIDIYGEQPVFQYLDEAMVQLQMTKTGNEVTFVTDVECSLRGMKEFGLVIWFDRGRMAAALKKMREASE